METQAVGVRIYSLEHTFSKQSETYAVRFQAYSTTKQFPIFLVSCIQGIQGWEPKGSRLNTVRWKQGNEGLIKDAMTDWIGCDIDAVQTGCRAISALIRDRPNAPRCKYSSQDTRQMSAAVSGHANYSKWRRIAQVVVESVEKWRNIALSGKPE